MRALISYRAQNKGPTYSSPFCDEESRSLVVGVTSYLMFMSDGTSHELDGNDLPPFYHELLEKAENEREKKAKAEYEQEKVFIVREVQEAAFEKYEKLNPCATQADKDGFLACFN